MDNPFSNLSDTDCENILHRLRWPEGVRCPKCNKTQQKIYRDRRTNQLRYLCPQCRIRFNDRAGTILAGTRLTLRQWFEAIYLIINSNATAADIAVRLKINRHTAETIRRLAHKEEPWCRNLLKGIAGAISRNPAEAGPLMPLKAVEDYLGVSRQTVYRLIAEGALSAVKVRGQWRFKPEEVQKYLTRKLSRYGTTAITENIFFRPEVLDKYKKDKTKYYIEDEAYQGWVGNKEDFNYMQKVTAMLGRGEKEAVSLSRVAFYHIHYRKVVTPEGHPALAIHHKDYQSLPPEEYVHWSNYQIWNKK